MRVHDTLLLALVAIMLSSGLLAGCATSTKTGKQTPNVLLYDGQYIHDQLSVGERKLYAVDSIGKKGAYIMLEQGGVMIVQKQYRSRVQSWDAIDRLLIIRTDRPQHPYRLVNTTYIENARARLL